MSEEPEDSEEECEVETTSYEIGINLGCVLMVLIAGVVLIAGMYFNPSKPFVEIKMQENK